MSRQIRILHIGIDATLGGIERFLINVYNNCSSEFHMDFVTTAKTLHYPLDEMISRDHDYEVIHVAPLSKPMAYFLDIYRVIKNGNYDVVHIHKNSLANPLPIFAAKLVRGQKIIIHSHNTQPSNSRRLGSLLHQFNKHIIGHIAAERLACSHLAGDWLFYPGQYHVIHNAIQVEKFVFNSEVRKRVRNELHLQDKFVIGCVARISDQKNQLFSLKILQEMIKKDKNICMVFVGGCADTPEGQAYDAKVRAAIKTMELQNYVMMLGSCDDTNELYQAFDVFLLPSKYEGLCIAAIEAQAAGLTSIVSSVLPPETKVSGERYIPMNIVESTKRWANVLFSCRGGERMNMREQIFAAGYDMAAEIKKIETIYDNLANNY